jgi:hypothetical protein
MTIYNYNFTPPHIFMTWCLIKHLSTDGSAIAQEISRRLPTAAARVRVRAKHVGFVVDKAALGQGFSEYFGFLCQSSFHQILHHHNHPGLAQEAYWWPK